MGCFNMHSEQEEKFIKTILKRAETECIKCAMWDEVAKNYDKRGMCQECFKQVCNPINNYCQHDQEF